LSLAIHIAEQSVPKACSAVWPRRATSRGARTSGAHLGVTWHTWLFYHDPLSLSLMMAKFIDWMNTQFHNGMSYCNRLVKPESRRNAGTVF